MSERESSLEERAHAALRQAGFSVIERDARPGVGSSKLRADLVAWGPNEQGEFAPVVLVEVKSARSETTDQRVLAHLASYANAFGTEENYVFDGEWWIAGERFDRLHPVEVPRSPRPLEETTSVTPDNARRLLTSSMWSIANQFRSQKPPGEIALAVLRHLKTEDRSLDWLFSLTGYEGAEALIGIIQRQFGGRSPDGTPPPLAEGMARLLRPANDERVLDPFSGLGALLWSCRRLAAEHHRSVNLVGIDRNPTTVELATEIASLTDSGDLVFEVGDAFDDPIVANWDGHFISHPPFGLRLADPVLLPDGRDSTNGDVAVLALVAANLDPGRRAVVLLPRPVLYRKTSEGLRTWLMANRRVVAVIGLPPGALDSVSIPTTIVVIERSEPSDTIVANLQDDWAEQLSADGEFMGEYTERLIQ